MNAPTIGAAALAAFLTAEASAAVWLFPQDGALRIIANNAQDGDTIYMTADSNSHFDNLELSDSATDPPRSILVEANGHRIYGNTQYHHSAIRMECDNDVTLTVRNATIDQFATSYPQTVIDLQQGDGRQTLILEGCHVMGRDGERDIVAVNSGPNSLFATDCTFDGISRMVVYNVANENDPSSLSLYRCDVIRSDFDDYAISAGPADNPSSVTLSDCTFSAVGDTHPFTAIKLGAGENVLDGVFVEGAGELAVVSNGATTIGNTTICAASEDINLSTLLVGPYVDAGGVLLTYGDCTSPIVPSCVGDLDEDGTVGFGDLTILLNAWGACQ